MVYFKEKVHEITHSDEPVSKAFFDRDIQIKLFSDCDLLLWNRLGLNE